MRLHQALRLVLLGFAAFLPSCHCDGCWGAKRDVLPRTNPDWRVELVGKKHNINKPISLAQGKDGVLHLGYQTGFTCASFAVATLNGSNWSVLLPSDNHYCKNSDLAFVADPEFIGAGPAPQVSRNLAHYGGDMPHMIFDAAGGVHISAYDNGYPQYTYWADGTSSPDGRSWEKRLDRHSPGLGQCGPFGESAIALDHAGQPHVIYMYGGYTGVGGALLHAFWDGTSWARERIDDGFECPVEMSLQFDTDGKGHVAYSAYGRGFLIKVASRETGVWVTEEVIASPPMQDYNPGISNLVITPDGTEHLAIRHGGRPAADSRERLGPWTWKIEYARREKGGGWTFTPVESESDILGTDGYTNEVSIAGLALAVDSHGIAHIAYARDRGSAQWWDDPNLRADLIYARWRNGAWEKTVVEGGGNSGYDVAMLVDAADVPHLAFSSSHVVAGKLSLWAKHAYPER